MRRSYSREVRDYVVVERYRGKPWQEIAADASQKFNTKPPSIRIMQNWFQAYQASSDDPTGVKFMAKAIEEAVRRAIFIAYGKMMLETPTPLQLIQQHRVPVEDAGVMLCLHLLEGQVRRHNFDRIVSDYQRRRDEFGLITGER